MAYFCYGFVFCPAAFAMKGFCIVTPENVMVGNLYVESLALFFLCYVFHLVVLFPSRSDPQRVVRVDSLLSLHIIVL